MANTINPRPLEPFLKELEDKGFSRASIRLFRDMVVRIEKALTNLGQIQSVAPVTGRTEGIGTTVTQLNSSGLLKDADKVAADGATFGRINMTALTSNDVDLSKTGVVSKTADNIAETSALKWRTPAHSSTQPTNIVITGADTGAGTASVSFPAFTMRVPGLADYTASGGIALGLLNSTTYYIYFDDPTFSGSGALNVTTDANAIFSNTGRFYYGKVTTPAGGGGPTAGVTGGTGGGLNRNTVLA